MNTGRTQRTVLAGTFTAFLLVAVLGNQWVYGKLLDHFRAGENSGWRLLGRVSFPHWVVSKSGKFEDMPSRSMTAMIVGALLLILAVALVVMVCADRAGGFNPIVSGWFATVVGGAVYGVVVLAIAGGGSGRRSLDNYLAFLTDGAGFGLLTGWTVGIACALAAGSAASAAAPATGPPASTPPMPGSPPGGGGYPY